MFRSKLISLGVMLGLTITIQAQQFPRPLQQLPGPRVTNTPNITIYQTPVRPKVIIPIRMDEGDLQNFLEDSSEAKFRHCVDDVDVDIDNRRGIMEIEIDADNFTAYLQVQNYIRSLPHVRGYRLIFINRDLEDMAERSLGRLFGRVLDNVNVNVNGRMVEVELELRAFVPFNQVRQIVTSVPELAGYALRIEIDIDN